MEPIGAQVRLQARRMAREQREQMRSQQRVAPYEGPASKQRWYKSPSYRRGDGAVRQSRMAVCGRCGRDGRYAVSSVGPDGEKDPRYRLSHQLCHWCKQPLGRGAGNRWRKGNER